MKLKRRPNHFSFMGARQSGARKPLRASFLLLAGALLLAAALVNCVDLFPPSTQSSVQQRNQTQLANRSQALRDVKDLHLTSDFRAVKLRWSYEQFGANSEPAAFSVRYCELTSWNVEIKCRQRELRVDSGAHSSNFSVIKQTGGLQWPLDAVRQLEPQGLAGESRSAAAANHYYEAQIFDLRALTNYTFQVQVARFAHEPPPPTNLSAPLDRGARGRQQLGRQLQEEPQAPDSSAGGLQARVETKAFGAEATKCLANVSEVVVNTGRFFGGRISVEDAADPRCQLLGNKSSEQTSYLFRIDHQACNSRLVEGSRIESMVLVHENKDILTHNTARFLVLCNFLKKSFTLRASVSLPKVNGVLGGGGGGGAGQARPAVITPLARKPDRLATFAPDWPDERPAEARAVSAAPTFVSLGSMPGVFRARGSLNQAERNSSSLASAIKRQHLDELETNTIEKFAALPEKSRPAESSAPKSNATRQSKELAGQAQSRARLLQLGAEELEPRVAPHAVEVQSKVLFVERAPGVQLAGSSQALVQRAGRQHNAGVGRAPLLERAASDNNNAPASLAPQHLHQQLQQQQQPANASDQITARGQTRLKQSAKVNSALQQQQQQQAELLQLQSSASAANLQSAPIILTNNHRVSGLDYATPPSNLQRAASSLAAARAPPSQEEAARAAAGNYSIKYSAAKVDEFPVGGDDDVPIIELNPSGQAAKLAVGAHPQPAPQQQQQQQQQAQQALSQRQADLATRARSGRMQRPANSPTAAAAAAAAAADAASLHANNSPKSATQGAKQQPQPADAWAVDDRMGELLGVVDGSTLATGAGVADLLADQTSDEFSNRQLAPPGGAAPQTQLVQHNGSLAQNLTSYFLKWSLKTLTNLAKKSLESLAKGNAQLAANETLAEAEFEAEAGRALSSSESPVDASESSSKGAQVEATERPSRAAHSTQPPPTTTTPSTGSKLVKLLQPSSPSPSRAAGEQLAEELLDGFITASTRRSDDKLASSAPTARAALAESNQTSASQPSARTTTLPSPTRPTNYSKSLDLSRVGEQQPVGRANKQPTGAKANASHHQRLHQLGAASAAWDETHKQQLEAADINKSANANALNHRDGSFYSSWLFYSAALFVALVTGIVLTFWLVSAPIRGGGGAAASFAGATQAGRRTLNLAHCLRVEACGKGGGVASAAATNGAGLNKRLNAASESARTPIVHHPIKFSTTNGNSGARLAFSCNVNSAHHDNNNNNNNNSLDEAQLNGSEQSGNNSNGATLMAANQLMSQRGQHNVLSASSSYQNFSDHSKFEQFLPDRAPALTGNANGRPHSANSHHQGHLLATKARSDSSEAGSSEILLRPNQQSPGASSSAASNSQCRTRSTSADSTLIAGENDCKNNEFLYTEHVLLNTGTSFGESYA